MTTLPTTTSTAPFVAPCHRARPARLETAVLRGIDLVRTAWRAALARHAVRDLQRRTHESLAALDERTLADIGVRRVRWTHHHQWASR
jgi:uncharacterized protein YjiS (DUF1127 family)